MAHYVAVSFSFDRRTTRNMQIIRMTTAFREQSNMPFIKHYSCNYWRVECGLVRHGYI